MPTYEYICKCGAEFEDFQSITAEPVAECPECGGKAKRMISAGAGLIFKGSGFYITDYKNNGDNGKSAKSEGEGSTKDSSEKKTEATSDSNATTAKPSTDSAPAKSTPAPAPV